MLQGKNALINGANSGIGKAIAYEFGRIDILINNAGIQTEKSFVDLTEEVDRVDIDLQIFV